MISLGFSTRQKNPLSRLIRKVTNAKFSHVWIRYTHPLFKGDVIIDADIRGIIEVPYHEYVAIIDNVVELAPPEGVNLSRGMPAILEVLGDDYDVFSLVGRLWVYLCRWFGMKVRNPLGNPNIDCCVENVCRLLIASRALEHSVDAEQEDPQSLYDRLIAMGWKARPDAAPASP